MIRVQSLMMSTVAAIFINPLSRREIRFFFFHCRDNFTIEPLYDVTKSFTRSPHSLRSLCHGMNIPNRMATGNEFIKIMLNTRTHAIKMEIFTCCVYFVTRTQPLVQVHCLSLAWGYVSMSKHRKEFIGFRFTCMSHFCSVEKINTEFNSRITSFQFFGFNFRALILGEEPILTNF